MPRLATLLSITLLGTAVYDIPERGAPPTPVAGFVRLFNDEATGELSVLHSNGSVVSLEATGGFSDGDKGDITVTASGATWSVDSGAVQFSEIGGAATDAQVPDSITVSLAATSTALAANGGNCSGNQFALGVDASGVGECAQPAFSNLSGAATDAQVPDNITVTLASTATALAANPTNCNAGQAPLGVDASGNVEGCFTPAGGGGPTTLTSTTTQSDAVIATYTAITGLSFTAAASTNYLIDCYIIHTSTAATTGINFAWDTPASPTAILMTGYTTTTATGGNEGFHQNGDNVGTTTSATVVTVQRLAKLSTLFRNGANATAMSLGFTPETANSVSVIAGSVCQYRTY